MLHVVFFLITLASLFASASESSSIDVRFLRIIFKQDYSMENLRMLARPCEFSWDGEDDKKKKEALYNKVRAHYYLALFFKLSQAHDACALPEANLHLLRAQVLGIDIHTKDPVKFVDGLLYSAGAEKLVKRENHADNGKRYLGASSPQKIVKKFFRKRSLKKRRQ